MRDIRVFTDREDEDLTWLLAWYLATQNIEELNDYDVEKDNRVTITNGIADKPFGTFLLVSSSAERKRALAFVYEWALFGYEPAQRCMQAFYRAMLSMEEAV